MEVKTTFPLEPPSPVALGTSMFPTAAVKVIVTPGSSVEVIEGVPSPEVADSNSRVVCALMDKDKNRPNKRLHRKVIFFIM